MGIFSSIIFGGKKKTEEERMQRAAQGRSALGNTLGTSPYMREWRRQRDEIVKQHEKEERKIRKQWRLEDDGILRKLEKTKGRYERRLGPEKAEKYYGAYERDERRRIQRDREKVLLNKKLEKNDSIRSIKKDIGQYRDSGSYHTAA